MAKFTKRAICMSFLRLLNERPLDQISVKDIVEDCGVNRKTFYYYFQDIYALVDECFRDELERIKRALPEDVSWQEAQKALAGAMLKNRTALLHVCHALDYAQIEQAAYDAAMDSLPDFILARAGGAEAEEGDVRLIAELSASALAGFLVRWVRGGMKGEPNAMIDRAAAIMEGTAELAISNAVRLKNREK